MVKNIVTTIEGLDYKRTKSADKILDKKLGKALTKNTIPGLNQTVTYKETITICEYMAPQAITIFRNNYILITAYCTSACGKEHNSVIYVIDKYNHEYKTTLILDRAMHVGGIACVDDCIWVCDSNIDNRGKYHLRAYDLKGVSIEDKIPYRCVCQTFDVEIEHKPSFINYSDGIFFVGTFKKDAKLCPIHMFKQEGRVFHYKGNFVIDGISKVQGITIYNEYMLVYTSYGRYNKSKMYVFKDSVNKFRKNNIVYNKNGNKKIREIRLPNMMESCCLEDKKFYFITESASRCYRQGKGFMNIILRPYDKYVVYDNIFKV